MSAALAAPGTSGRYATVRWQISQRVTGSRVTVTGKFLVAERVIKPSPSLTGGNGTTGKSAEHRCFNPMIADTRTNPEAANSGPHATRDHNVITEDERKVRRGTGQPGRLRMTAPVSQAKRAAGCGVDSPK